MADSYVESAYLEAQARIAELEAVLRRIGAHEKGAREMVAKGFHNTTLAIDLAGMANAVLSASQSDAGADHDICAADAPRKA